MIIKFGFEIKLHCFSIHNKVSITSPAKSLSSVPFPWTVHAFWVCYSFYLSHKTLKTNDKGKMHWYRPEWTVTKFFEMSSQHSLKVNLKESSHCQRFVTEPSFHTNAVLFHLNGQVAKFTFQIAWLISGSGGNVTTTFMGGFCTIHWPLCAPVSSNKKCTY